MGVWNDAEQVIQQQQLVLTGDKAKNKQIIRFGLSHIAKFCPLAKSTWYTIWFRKDSFHSISFLHDTHCEFWIGKHSTVNTKGTPNKNTKKPNFNRNTATNWPPTGHQTENYAVTDDKTRKKGLYKFHQMLSSAVAVAFSPFAEFRQRLHNNVKRQLDFNGTARSLAHRHYVIASHHRSINHHRYMENALVLFPLQVAKLRIFHFCLARIRFVFADFSHFSHALSHSCHLGASNTVQNPNIFDSSAIAIAIAIRSMLAWDTKNGNHVQPRANSEMFLQIGWFQIRAHIFLQFDCLAVHNETMHWNWLH